MYILSYLHMPIGEFLKWHPGSVNNINNKLSLFAFDVAYMTVWLKHKPESYKTSNSYSM